MMKECKKCHIVMPISQFHKHKNHKDGLNNECKSCVKKYAQGHRAQINKRGRHRRKENPDITFKAGLKRYGIAIEEYNRLFKLQNGLCAICGRPETATYRGKVKRLAVDHNHNTNQNRELLCHKCNIILGDSQENIPVLEACINYLKKWSTNNETEPLTQ